MKEGAMINKSLLLGPGWAAFGSNELLWLMVIAAWC
jgi:hypothetical protein